MNGEWKAVTVLGGSLLEALLLWSIQKHCGEELTSALERLPREIGKPRDANRPETWSLVHYIEVARSLREIDEPAADAARLARDFRNLIHPGREQRPRTKCGRATAMSPRAPSIASIVYWVHQHLAEGWRKNRLHSIRDVPHRGRHHVRVSVCGERDRAVAEQLHDDSKMYALS